MRLRMKGTLLLLEHILLLCLCEATRPGERIGQSLKKQLKQVVKQQAGQGQGQGQGQGHLQRPTRPGQGQCGHNKCINFPGLVCDRGNGKCNCPGGKVGDGRVQCADPARACLCTMYGDPHVVNFKGQKFTLPLPCNHVLADLATPPARPNKGCRVFITGRAKYFGRQNNSEISYENQVEIYVTTPSAIFTTLINEKGFNNPHLIRLSKGVKGSDEDKGSDEGGSSEVDNKGGRKQAIQQYKTGRRRRRGAYGLRVNTQTDEDGFHQVTIPSCQLNVKYRAHDGAFSLQTPLRSIERRGLCGWCGGKSDRGSSLLTRQQTLEVVLASLYAVSPIDHTDANIYPSCTALTDTFASCPLQRRPLATSFCGQMLTNSDVNRCLAGKEGKEHVQDVFAKCYKLVCTKHTKCATYLAFFRDCLSETQATDLVKDKLFCN
ncbi:uncharacterized protein LOC124143953 [Haliotis rufescens]|uniref:uncharacterized protein LOC124143953 n=1 Tax=Haliotis rufescens TaxID=6454 RepID=UPI00201E9004|nr:uncharacterized protein LOC124143953 [Haliotis rufescens]